MISIETTEGRMEINDEFTELYKQRGDLCCPMIGYWQEDYDEVAVKKEKLIQSTWSDKSWPQGWWSAACPMSGKQYIVFREAVEGKGTKVTITWQASGIVIGEALEEIA